jgi:hypothetical protein
MPVRRMPHAYVGRGRDASGADGAGRGMSDNDVGTGFGAMAEISPEALQVCGTRCCVRAFAEVAVSLGGEGVANAALA